MKPKAEDRTQQALVGMVEALRADVFSLSMDVRRLREELETERRLRLAMGRK